MGLGGKNPETTLNFSGERSPSPRVLLGASDWHSEEGCGGKDILHLTVHPRSESCLCSVPSNEDQELDAGHKGTA